jgi:hypothetical protein
MKGEFERDATPLLGFISTLLGLALIVALLTLFGSLPPPRPRRTALRT